jgi:nucleoid-associated protein EbfC
MRDLMGMMKQAQALQSKMEDMQKELEAAEVEGQSGGGLVEVKLTAKGTMKGVRIDPSLLKPDEAEILEDLLVAAHTDARAKAERLAAEKMQELTGGLPLPAGFKLPF